MRESSVNRVRVVDIDGNPWFVAADVFAVLYGRTSGVWTSVKSILSKEDWGKYGRTVLGLPPGRDAVALTESGLYKLIMRSDKQEAKAFQDWITKEVLPSIRKHGAYVKDQEKVATGEMSALSGAQACVTNAR